MKLEWLREFIRSDFYYEEVDLEEQYMATEASTYMATEAATPQPPAAGA